MTAMIAERAVERRAARECALADGRPVALAVTARVTTPGECCVNIASTLRFDYAPPLPDDVAVRLDDRLYDGLYAGLAALDGPLPPEHLKVVIVGVASAPSLATLVAGGDWPVIGQLGAALEALAAEAVAAAAGALLEEGGA